LIAACAFGLEAIVRRELQALGIDAKISDSGRVQFRGTRETICLANLWLRTADRVLIKVAEFPAPDFDALFDTIKAFPWATLIPVDGCFPVTGRSHKSQLTSVPACQRATKRAMVDALKREHGTDVLPETGAQYKVDIALLKDVATVTLDTTGRSLHRRGYRTHISGAPLKETLASALVLLSFWKTDRPLLDPFCGSGTIPIEAARIGRNMAPGIDRDFLAEAWPDFPGEIWSDARSDAKQKQLPALEQRIVASDIDGKVLVAARDNAERAGVADDIHFHAAAMQETTSKRRFGCLITNPPYGQRLGYDQDWELDALYKALPQVLRKLPTWSFYFLTAYSAFEKTVGREADRRRKLYNGRIECTYYQFHGPRPVAGEPLNEPDGEHLDEPVGESNALKEETPQDTIKTPATIKTPKPIIHAAGSPAFRVLPESAPRQVEDFTARLKKRAKHLRRWPKQRGITCMRLYEKDIPEIPLVVDRYEDHLHITEYERPHERDAEQHANWLELMAKTAGEALDIPSEKIHLKTRQRQRGSTQHSKIANKNERFEVNEGGLKFLVNLDDYVDTGLFLDHRTTRQMVRDEAKGGHFLNLFAYTGSFTVYAAAGGAKSTTTVDLSQNYLDWAQDNLKLNGFAGKQHRFEASDVAEWIENQPIDVKKYDLVVLDPPTFSNSKSVDEDWNVQTGAVPLLKSLLPLVRNGGVIYFSNNFRRFKFDEDEIEASKLHEISKQTVPEDFRNRRIHRCWRIVK